MPPSPAVSSPSSPVFPHHSLSLSSLLSRSLSPSLGLNLPAPPSPAARVVLRSMEPPKQSAAARTPETVAVQGFLGQQLFPEESAVAVKVRLGAAFAAPTDSASVPFPSRRGFGLDGGDGFAGHGAGLGADPFFQKATRKR